MTFFVFPKHVILKRENLTCTPCTGHTKGMRPIVDTSNSAFTFDCWMGLQVASSSEQL